MKIKLILNGKKKTFNENPMKSLAKILRESGLLSIRTNCDGEGTCGACSVILNGVKVNSCQVRFGQLSDGDDIFTAEGLAKGRELHPIQRAFLKAGVVQCGHCTPGMMLAVKEMLDNCENPDMEDMKDYLSGNLCRCTGYKQYFDVLKYLKDENPGQPKTFRDDLRIVGKPVEKVDGPRLVKAEPSYVGDMVTPDALIIKVKKSPYPHAFIKDIDTSEAEELEGVELIVTYKNGPSKPYNTAGQGYPEPSPYDFHLVDRTMRYYGDRVAIVAAVSEEIADKAIELIKVEYELLPAVFSPFDAKKPGAVLIQDRDISVDPLPIGQDPKTNRAAHNAGGIGDVEKGLQEADVVVERDYGSHRVQCTPMETHRCFGYIENGRLTLRASTQVPWHLRRIIANILDIKENQIHIIKERVGGGYGSKQDLVIEDIVAWVVWQTGKPAYHEMTREEEFVNSRVRHTMFFRVRAGAKNDGTITALDIREVSDTGPYGNHCLTVPMNACSKSLPLFKCENMRYDVSTYYTNNVISGAYQGYGAPQGSFAIQMAVAELAHKLGIDQLELLRKNMVEKGYHLEILKSLGEGQEGIAQVISSCGLKECLDRGAELIGWDKPLVSDKPYIKKGRGAAIIQQGSGLPGIDSANAEIKMLGDGTFMILMGGTDLGTGLDTLAVKVSSETLCCDFDRFSIISSDTDVTPFDVGAYASSGTYFSGMAVYRAALDMKSKLLEKGAELLKTDLKNVKIEYPGFVTDGTSKLSYAEISAATQCGTGSGQIIAEGNFTTEEAPIPYGAHFAEVSVDTRTGEVVVDKYYAVQECGTPINPELALGQVYGGVVKSIGHCIYEEMKFDNKGKCLNPNFMDYKVPMIRDLPEEFKCELIEVADHLGPYGGKSVSEISTNGAAPAIGIAIYNATGIWMQEWPFTAEYVYKALKENKDVPHLYDFTTGMKK